MNQLHVHYMHVYPVTEASGWMKYRVPHKLYAPRFSLGRKKSPARAGTQPPTMTVGLHHVAAAAAFVMATTSSVVLRANASTSSGCDFTESPPCSECWPCAAPCSWLGCIFAVHCAYSMYVLRAYR